MNRTAVGLISLILLLTGLLLFIFKPGDQSDMWMSACVRVGFMLAVVWLAHPQLSYAPRWFLFIAVAGVAVLLVIKQPRTLIMLAVIFTILARLRPTPQPAARANSRKPPLKKTPPPAPPTQGTSTTPPKSTK